MTPNYETQTAPHSFLALLGRKMTASDCGTRILTLALSRQRERESKPTTLSTLSY